MILLDNKKIIFLSSHLRHQLVSLINYLIILKMGL